MTMAFAFDAKRKPSCQQEITQTSVRDGSVATEPQGHCALNPFLSASRRKQLWLPTCARKLRTQARFRKRPGTMIPTHRRCLFSPDSSEYPAGGFRENLTQASDISGAGRRGCGARLPWKDRTRDSLELGFLG